MQEISIAIACVVVLGVGAQWVAWRIGLPSILLLLIFGAAVGPLADSLLGEPLLDPDQLFGDLLFPLVSIAVALILYEGGLTLYLPELTTYGGVVRNLVTIGAVLTWLSAALAARLVFGFDAGVALLTGAVLVVTGPTVIGPMLRTIRPSGPVGPILKWEGIVIDPIGAVLAVLVFEVVAGAGSEHATAAHIGAALGRTILFGGGLGALAGGLLVVLLHRHLVPEFLQNAVSLMIVVAVFIISNQLAPESGLLAVTAMGVLMANQKLADVKHIVEFKENLRVLLISALFIILAARLDLSDLTGLGWRGPVFVLLLVLLVRPLSVLLSTIGSGLSRNERIFLAWMAPRGIVAAAVASLFALRLEETAPASAGPFAAVVFLTIIVTVAVYGLSAPALAVRLRVADPNPQGVLIAGAHAWARALAAVLQEKGFPVLLVDSNRSNISSARMAGLPTYSGSILAEHALDELELGGIGRLLAVTPNDWVNVLAVQRFAPIFGKRECYQVPPRAETEKKKPLHKHMHGRWLFGDELSFGELERRMLDGQQIKATGLSESFDFAAFRAMYGPAAVPLFLIPSAGRLQVLTEETKSEPQPGQMLISLVQPREAEDACSTQ